MGFEVGDKVIHVSRGQGVVKEIRGNVFTYPVVACFAETEGFDGILTFAEDGRSRDTDKYPSIYHADGYVPPVGGREPLRFKKGDLVLTSDNSSTRWWVNVFSHVDEIGNYRTFHSCTDSEDDLTYLAWQKIKPFNIENF